MSRHTCELCPETRHCRAHHSLAVLGFPPSRGGSGWRCWGCRRNGEIEADPEAGLGKTSCVQCEATRSINRRRLIHLIGTINPEQSRRVADVIRTLLNH